MICDKNIETVDCSYGDYHQNTDGKKHSGKCKVCGYANENLSHNYENYTSLDNGKHASLCTDCGYENIEDCEYTYEPAKIVYSENWAYSRDLSIVYSDNKKAEAAFADKHVGKGKSVSFTEFVITGGRRR